MTDGIMRKVARWLGIDTGSDPTSLEFTALVVLNDQLRSENESLHAELDKITTAIGDISFVRECRRDIPPDAPPLMIAHEIAKMDGAVIALLKTAAATKERQRIEASKKPRDHAGRFLASPTVLLIPTPTMDSH